VFAVNRRQNKACGRCKQQPVFQDKMRPDVVLAFRHVFAVFVFLRSGTGTIRSTAISGAPSGSRIRVSRDPAPPRPSPPWSRGCGTKVGGCGRVRAILRRFRLPSSGIAAEGCIACLWRVRREAEARFALNDNQPKSYWCATPYTFRTGPTLPAVGGFGKPVRGAIDRGSSRRTRGTWVSVDLRSRFRSACRAVRLSRPTGSQSPEAWVRTICAPLGLWRRPLIDIDNSSKSPYTVVRRTRTGCRSLSGGSPVRGASCRSGTRRVRQGYLSPSREPSFLYALCIALPRPRREPALPNSGAHLTSKAGGID